MDKLQREALEIKKAIPYLKPNVWAIQEDNKDRKTNFIYNAQTIEEILKKLENESEDLKTYGIHRWYNFKTSKMTEEIFTMLGAQKENNIKHKTKDIYINSTPYDVKLTVYPKKYYNADFNKESLIQWLYQNQSKQGRYHLENRLFVVCGKPTDTAIDKLIKKSDFKNIYNEVQNYMQYYNKNEITIHNKNIYSDVIWIN